jgi:hypothetical protein
MLTLIYILLLLAVLWWALTHLRPAIFVACELIALWLLSNAWMDMRGSFMLGALFSLMAAILLGFLGGMVLTREIEL